MSIALMEMVWATDLKMAEKAVLSRMANMTDDDGFACYLAVETLKKQTSSSRRTVQRAIAKFVADDLLVLLTDRDGGKRRAASYRINVGKLVEHVRPEERRRILKRFHVKQRQDGALSETAPKTDGASTASHTAVGLPRQDDALSDGRKQRQPRHDTAPTATPNSATMAHNPLREPLRDPVEGAPPLRAARPNNTGIVVTEEMKAWARANWANVDVELEAAQFVDHYLAKGETPKDVPAAWRKWVRRVHGAVPRQAEEGSAGGATGPAAPLRCASCVGEDDVLGFVALRSALRQAVKPTAWKSWLAPLHLLAAGADGLTLGAPTPFMRDWIEKNYRAEIARLAGRPVAIVVGQVEAAERRNRGEAA